MGVNGLWQVVQPCARPTNLATLNRKRLAVDASIWIYQFLKAVRDKEGEALRNSHVVGFFRRICKLLWFGIKPIFVFDGGAPVLKRQTIAGRKRRREGRREDAVRTAGKLLAVQMHRRAEEEEKRTKARASRAAAGQQQGEEEEEEQIPDMNEVVYVDEHGMSKQERMKNRTFRKQDPYHLPELQASLAEMAKPEDPRIMSVEELEEYARQFNNGEDINLYDFSKIDFNGDFFKSLPAADRYNILNAARLRSRLRMGLSKEQLEDMFPDRMAFSRFQIERVRERNMLTQRLMQEVGMTGLDLTINVNARVAGEKDREYILVKNDGAEGGWALGVVSKERDLGQSHKPIDVDAVEFQFQTKSDEEEDEDFEDVPIPGLNRLPPIPPEYKERYAGMELAEAYAARRQELYDRGLLREDADDESLFVGEAPPEPPSAEMVNQPLYPDEEDDINQAIALSLRSQHGVGVEPSPSPDDDLFGEVEMQPAPVWTQRAADTMPKPIHAKSGRVISSVVNNRATAAMRQQAADTGRVVAATTVVDANNESDSDSDSSIDLQRTLAKATQRSEPATRPLKSGADQNSFEGPLPFPKLDWSLFTKKAPEKQGKAVEKRAGLVAEGGIDAMAGGFEREPEDEDAPKPLPPWLADQGDIRESLKQQQTHQREINAEDMEEALREERLFQRQQERNMVDLVSSDEESDDVVEVIDNLSSAKQTIPTTGGVEKSPQGEVSKSLEPTFEDVEMVLDGVPGADAQVATAASPEPTFEDVAPATIIIPEPTAEAHPAPPMTAEQTKEHDDYLFGDHNSDSSDDEFNDPEEEELLLRMEEEAAEHARFASTLNNKPAAENLVDYEKELRQLRTQQRKDRRDADEVNHVMVTECQALLRLFGIPYITAPMEAEAQCAELVRLGLADGIVTDDSDIFLFGGTRVYKNMFNANKFVECYLAADLEREMSLGREQLVALAQLLGSDYTDGLQGVGPVTAVEIISEFPGADGLDKFREWWDEVQQRHRPKEADASSPFRKKFRRTQATKLFLPPGFPSPAVTEAYTKADVDSSRENFQWGVPDVEGLRQFLMSTIGWSKERTDDVLLPVVRDMNKREVEGTQANITRFFEGSVGAGVLEAFAPRQRAGTSKRMTEAVSRLKQKTLTGGKEGPQAGESTAKGKGAAGGSRKRRRATVVEDEDVDEFVEEDGVDGGEDSDEAVPVRTRSRGRGRGRGRGLSGAPGKRARA